MTGLVLIAAIFFIFMWLSPKPETDQTPDEEQTAQQSAVSPLDRDSLSATEHEWLVKNIADNGQPAVLADGRNAMRINAHGLELTAVGDSVYGTVTVGAQTLAWPRDVSPASDLPLKVKNEAIAMVRNTSNAMAQYGRFATFLQGTNQDIKLENDVLSLTLSSKSGSVTRARLLKYETEYNADETKNDKHPLVLFENGTDRMSFVLPLPQQISTSDLFFRPTVVNDSTVRMTLDLTADAYWGLEYVLPKGDSYVVRIRVVQHGVAPILKSNVRNLGFDWEQKIRRQEKGRMFEERNSGLFYKYAGGSVENLKENGNDSQDRRAKIKWIAFKNQFFSSVMIADRPFNTADFQSDVIKGQDYLKDVKTHAQVNDYDWNAENPVNFNLFLGPNLYPLLNGVSHRLDEGENLELTRLIPLGWTLFRWINVFVIIPVFNFLGSFISSYGLIILLLTILIKIVLFPLMYKSLKSQAKMRFLAPDIKAINDKYPGTDNAMIRQQKTMALYSRAGANPMSGCLPMLLQMPILFAMFTFFPSCIELRGESFLWAHNLAAPDAIISWSAHIPLVSEYFGNHISLFCLLMTVVNLLYTRMTMANNSSQMPGMKWMMYMMPIFFLVFFNNYAAGLSYYYFLSLLMSIGQTYAVRYFVKEEDMRKKMAENAKKPAKKSGFMARLEEMQRQQQQMLREQQAQKGGGKRR